MTKVVRKLFAMTTSALAVSVVGSPLQAQGSSRAAQDPEAQGIAEIVVTAQRRSEPIQKVPVAITALSGDAMASRGISNIESIHYEVPNLTLGTQTGIPRVVLRGIGLEGTVIGQESQVAAHINGVYLGRPINLLSSFYDIDRVEVLRGPQGTLYGRNTTGGAINIYSKRPDEDLDGFLTARYGNYNDVKVEGALGGALDADGKILQRIAFTFNRHDGYGINETTRQEIDNLKTYGFRSTTVLNPSEDLSIAIIGDYDRQDDRSGQYQYAGEGGNTSEPGSPGIRPSTIALGGVFASKPRNIVGDFGPKYDRKTWGVLADVNWSFSDDINIRSLTSYRYSKWFINTNLGGGSALSSTWNQGEKARQVSQDLQISGTAERFKWVIGGYFYQERYNGDQSVPINGLQFGLPNVYYNGFYAGAKMKTTALAIYGQGTYGLTDKLSLTVGGRYSTEKKTLLNKYEFDLATPYFTNQGVNPAMNREGKRWSSFTPKIGIEYQADPNTLFYASATKGFKSGSFNIGSFNNSVDPENLWAYEAGMKTTQFDRRLRLNLAGFYYDYKDIQLAIIRPGGTNTVLANAAKLESYGLEAEITALPMPRVELGVSAAWLHARYKNYVTVSEVLSSLGPLDLSGFSPSQAPDYTMNFSAQYTLPTSWGSIALRGEAFFVDRIYFDQFNRPVMTEPAHSRQNVFLTVKSADENWRVTGYVRNLSNERNIANAIQASIVSGFALLNTYESPRTYGIEISRRF